MAKELLPAGVWEEIEPLLPPVRPRTGPGRPPADNRKALQGIIFVLKTGIPWQMLPTEVFGVSGSSCWRKFHEWTVLGIWPQLHQRLLNRLGKLGGVDLDRVVVDAQSVRALKGARIADPTLPIAVNAGANAMC